MRFIILIIILLIAATAGYFTLQVAGNPSPSQKVVTQQEPKVEAATVLVARTAIPVGTVITEEMLDQQPWPKHLLLDGFVLSGSPDDNLIGMVARSDFQAQEPIIKGKLANPNDANFIAAALPAGMRALTLEVDAISGVAGYVFPGDRVDVVLTHNIPQDLADVRTSKLKAEFAESLITDVLVLAVDIRAAVASKTGQQPQKENKAPTNLTIAVSPEDVQKIRVAEKNGSLSLALRSLKDKEDASKASPTSIESVTSAAVSNRDDSVIIIRGVIATESKLPAALPAGAIPLPNGMMPNQIIMSAPPVTPQAPPPSN